MPPAPEKDPEFAALCPIKKDTPELKEIFRKLERIHLDKRDKWKKECEEIQKQHSARWHRKKEVEKNWRREHYQPPSELEEVISLKGANSAYADYSYEEIELI